MTGDQAATMEEEFDDFYTALHARISPPPPGQRERSSHKWQRRAAAVLAMGEAFHVLDVPTGCGKTTLIECHLFALAWQQREHGMRSLPLRLFWVVDRRAVVDQAFAHAEAVAMAIREAESDEIARVREQLASISGGSRESPIQVQRWRGGTGLRPEPISPVAPAVICSTVDQVGSRMLFRGYGVSARSRPIDAALVATDSLIVLDEAHIAESFDQTARSVAAAQHRAGTGPNRPLRLIRSTATPREVTTGEVFSLTPEERAEPEIEKRISTTKRARLVPSSRTADTLFKQASRLAAEVDGVIGVVANTVRDAREVFERLAEHLNAILIIGPNRPLARDRLLQEIPGRGSSEGPRPQLLVVATQTLEVGLDIDFDGMVTASAPLSALAQRLGRLDRAGELGESRAVVVNAKKCPVYGPLASETWAWLADRSENGEIDLGPDAIRKHRADDSPEEHDRTAITPRLMDWHIESLAQTSARPIPDPEVGVFLHGESAIDVADIQVAWRADLVGSPTHDAAVRREWEERVAVRLPHVGELMQLPYTRARRWLAGIEVPPFGDLEAPDPKAERESSATEAPTSFVIVPPRDADKRVRPRWAGDVKALRPGAVIVVPSRHGGCDRFGWSQGSRSAVDDLGDLRPTRPRVLIDAKVGLPTHTEEALRQAIRDIEAGIIEPAEAYEQLADHATSLLAERASNDPESPWRILADRLTSNGQVIPVPVASPTGLILVTRPRRAAGRPAKAEQSYRDHVRTVVDHARAFAQALTDDPKLRKTIEFAAEHHDLGKLDPRFQAWLNGGSRRDGLEPLAKSALPVNSPTSRDAQMAAAWPSGMRHEAISASLVHAAACDGLSPEIDLDLALHLILTHHGQHRPFYPRREESVDAEVVNAEVEGRTVSVPADLELPWNVQVERFWRLNRIYSPWGLAALESALVLADRLASAEADGEAEGE